MASRLVLGAALLITATGVAWAGENGEWRVVEASGQVLVGYAGEAARQPSEGEVLAPGMEVTTGDDGRVLLERDNGDRVTVTPNSQMGVVVSEQGGRIVELTHTRGVLLFDVEGRDSWNFEIDTPYLAAVVKGTTFTLTVSEEGTAVHVLDGGVEVTDYVSGSTTMVDRGQNLAVASLPDDLPTIAPSAAAPGLTRALTAPLPDVFDLSGGLIGFSAGPELQQAGSHDANGGSSQGSHGDIPGPNLGLALATGNGAGGPGGGQGNGPGAGGNGNAFGQGNGNGNGPGAGGNGNAFGQGNGNGNGPGAGGNGNAFGQDNGNGNGNAFAQGGGQGNGNANGNGNGQGNGNDQGH